MNAYLRNASNPPIVNQMDKKPFDLFNQDFIQNYKEINIRENNENLNIINSIFGNNGQPSWISNHSAESERERRLKLREMERLKRQEGISGGGYGQVDNSAIPISH